MATEATRKKAATESGLFLLIVAAAVILLNIFGASANKRVDATKNERYTLSKGSGQLVRSLKEPMLVDAYVTRGLAKLEVYVDDLTNLLSEYEAASDGKFKFTVIEAKTEELRERAKEDGLQPMAFAAQAETGDDQAAIAQGYLGLVLKYGAEKDIVPLNPGMSEGLEFQITMKIRELRDKADSITHRIGVLTGKKELTLSDTNLVPKRGQGGPNLKGIIEQYFPFYQFVDVDTKGGEEEIDGDLDGLILTQPGAAYTEKELRRVDQFLMRGNKALAVFASAVNISAGDAKMSAELDTRGLDTLLSGYGIEIEKNLLLDFGAQFQTIVPTQAGLAQIRHPPIAHVLNDPRFDDDKKLLDTGFATFFRLDEIAFPYPSGLKILKDKQPADVTIKVVARTTANTSELKFEEKTDLSLRGEGWEPKPDPEQHAIAAVAEGPLKSAFAGSSDNMGVETPEVAAAPSRVLVVASSQFLTNPFAYAGNGPDFGGQFAMMGNVGGDQTLLAVAQPYAQRYLTNVIMAFKNTLDWITGDQDLIAVSAKIIANPNLRYTQVDPPTGAVSEEQLRALDEENKQLRHKTQQRIEWTLTLGLPILFAAFGVWRWRTRLRHRSSYQVG